MEPIKVNNEKDIPIEKGDFFSKQISREGTLYKVVVIKKEIIDEVKDCVSTDDDPKLSVDWIMGLISKAAAGADERVKVYEVE